MKVCIIGLGYVGLTAAACIAHQGHDVVGVDVSEEKVASVNSGVSPIHEPGLPELLTEALQQGRLVATSSLESALPGSDIAIVCVGTPSAPDGSHNMSFIAEVTRQIASVYAREEQGSLCVVYRSTIRPGTIDGLVLPILRAQLGARAGEIEVVYNPEFLRESSAISDFFNPPKIVIGTSDGKPSAIMDELNRTLGESPVFYTRFPESEITKFVDNTFHALKVSFANELGRICSAVGVDASVVHKIFTSDTKLNISPYYLRPGGPFGGSCLPKDVRAFQHLALEAGANTHVIDSIMRSNEAHKAFFLERCTRHLPTRAQVLILGLSFKKDSDDLRESPHVDLARRLIQLGHIVTIFDPDLSAAKLVGQNLGYAYGQLPSLETLLKGASELASTYDLIVDNRGAGSPAGVVGARVVNTFSI